MLQRTPLATSLSPAQVSNARGRMNADLRAASVNAPGYEY